MTDFVDNNEYKMVELSSDKNSLYTTPYQQIIKSKEPVFKTCQIP